MLRLNLGALDHRSDDQPATRSAPAITIQISLPPDRLEELHRAGFVFEAPRVTESLGTPTGLLTGPTLTR